MISDAVAGSVCRRSHTLGLQTCLARLRTDGRFRSFRTQILWLPLICGFVWSDYQRMRAPVDGQKLKIAEYEDELRLSP